MIGVAPAVAQAGEAQLRQQRLHRRLRIAERIGVAVEIGERLRAELRRIQQQGVELVRARGAELYAEALGERGAAGRGGPRARRSSTSEVPCARRIAAYAAARWPLVASAAADAVTRPVRSQAARRRTA